MITTPAIAIKTAAANAAGYTIGIVLSALYRSLLIMPIAKTLNPITNEKIHRTHAIIDARALKIGGISPSLHLVGFHVQERF
jgi:hypothetical protein